MKEKKNLEQLFRREFESFGVQPSKKVWREVHSELFFKNFFRFSPWSVNVWYAGGVLLLASVAAVSVFKPFGESNSDQEIFTIAIPGPSPENDSVTDSVIHETLNREVSIKDFKVQKAINEPEVKKPPPIINPSMTSGAEKRITQQAAAGETGSNHLKSYEGQTLVAWFSCQKPEGCVPLSTSFQNNSQNAVSYQWSFGDGGSSTLENPSYIFDEPGTWFVSLTAYTSNNDISIFTDSVQVNPLPEARFSMDVQGLPGEGQPVYFYNYSRGADRYQWDFGDGSTSNLKEPDHYFLEKALTHIKLLAISPKGCIDSTFLYDAFKDGEPAFIFPTAFSPNTSGPQSGQYSKNSPDNDIFYPMVKEDPEEYQLKVFNRTGTLLFESNDIHIGWDGYYRQELLPKGVYVWKARATFGDGRNVVKMGDVTLLWGGRN